MSQFYFKVNEDLTERDVMIKIGKLWWEYRCKIWNDFYDPLLSKNDLIKNVPTKVNMEQWVVFVDYRLRPSTMVNTFHYLIVNKVTLSLRKTDFIFTF